MREKILDLEKRLDNILPDDWDVKFETHEDLYNLFERSFDKAEDIAREAIKLLKEVQDES
jgi:hypothetical protein